MRIGTRGSALALVQARWVAERLGPEVEIVEITTLGDRGAAALDKSRWVSELERALLEDRIDLAVHSAKDMPAALPDGLTIAAYLPREDARDAFISRKAKSLQSLAQGAVVGTASPRRQAMVKRLRPDLEVVSLRGNVQTRLRKLDDGVVDATLLALAGLKRLGLANAATALLDVETFPPAVGQGAIALQARADDARVRDLLAPIADAATGTALFTERAFLAVLDG
ncbi:MAG: hydroxymethylbilane synthase, partial [Solirubrobacteraceae bacterium]